MDNIMTASPFFIANKASVSDKSKVKSWPFRFKLKHHNLIEETKRRNSLFGSVLVYRFTRAATKDQRMHNS